jgi:hypothetical protein
MGYALAGTSDPGMPVSSRPCGGVGANDQLLCRDIACSVSSLSRQPLTVARSQAEADVRHDTMRREKP